MDFSAINFILLCGKTVSGKTQVIQELQRLCYPVIDLEKIASHRGSAFGGLLLNDQPSQKKFETELEKKLQEVSHSKNIFIEQKASSIGKRKIPAELYKKMNEGISIGLQTEKSIRIKNILNEYSEAGQFGFLNSLEKLKKRLPGTVIDDLTLALQENNFKKFVEIIIDYYDSTFATRFYNRVFFALQRR